MNNQELYDRAKEAIMNLHDDKSVSIETAIENLKALSDEIDLLIDGLECSL